MGIRDNLSIVSPSAPRVVHHSSQALLSIPKPPPFGTKLVACFWFFWVSDKRKKDIPNKANLGV